MDQAVGGIGTSHVEAISIEIDFRHSLEASEFKIDPGAYIDYI